MGRPSALEGTAGKEDGRITEVVVSGFATIVGHGTMTLPPGMATSTGRNPGVNAPPYAPSAASPYSSGLLTGDWIFRSGRLRPGYGRAGQ
jgi:hypothetical protein